MKLRNIIFACLFAFASLSLGVSQTEATQDGKDWGAYPADYKELAQKWLLANVHEASAVQDLQICSPEKWWVRQSLLRGGKTNYGYRTMIMFTPKKRNGSYDKRQIHNLHIRNGEVIDDWKAKVEGGAVRGETPQIEVRDLGISATQDLSRPGDLPFAWALSAQLKERGHFLVTATTSLDPAISTTFECNGPGDLFQMFFSRTEFPSLWATGKQSGPRWFPFHFIFEDTTSNKRFELDQWAYVDFRDLDKLKKILEKEGKKQATAAKSVERIKVDFDNREWKVGYSNGHSEQEITEFVLSDETVDNWTELVTLQSFPGAAKKMTPEESMLKAKDMTVKECPTAMWNVLRKEENEILYEWRTTDCQGTDNEYEIAKIIKGKKGLHRVAYSCKKLPLSDEERKRWMDLIGKARLGGDS